MHPRASITMSARPNLEIERTVHPIFFSAKDGGQMLRHDSVVCLATEDVHRQVSRLCMMRI
jgi:hypothetical protein